MKVIKQGSGVQQSRQHLQAVLPELGLSPRPMPPPSHCSPTERPMPTRGLFFKIQLKVKVNWKFPCLLFSRDHCTHRQKVKAWMGKKLQSVSYAQVPFYPSWRQNHTCIDLFEEKCKIKMKKDFCGSKFQTIMKRDTLWQFWKINYFGKGWMCFHQREYEFRSNPQFHNSTWPRVSESTKGISIGFWSLKQWRVKSGVIEFQNS